MRSGADSSADRPFDMRCPGNLIAARSAHTATLLPNGRVLIAGGTDGSNALASADVFQ